MTENIVPSETNNRLDRIEALVQSNAEATAANTRNIDQLSQLQLQMIEESSEYRRNMLEMRADTLEMQSEVRGLQTENRRILDRLLNEN
jgi:hypothetical protein